MPIDLPKTPCLLMLDFDGTLVPIAPTPSSIQIPPALPHLLTSLQKAGHALYVVSGRQASDINSRLEDVQVAVIGLHGLDWPGQTPGPRSPLLDEALQLLQPLVVEFPGFLVEDKSLIIAAHTRRVAIHQQALAAHKILAIFDELALRSRSLFPSSQLSVLSGRCVFELRPLNMSKAKAVDRLIKQHPNHFPIYIGDDTTDEEAFTAIPKTGLSIRVEPEGSLTNAGHRLKSVDEVYEFLQKLTVAPK